MAAIGKGFVKDDVWQPPPFPQVNGPLFAVSRSVAQLLVQDSLPYRWLERMSKTAVARASRAQNGRIPTQFKGIACFPMGDSALSYWVA